MAPFTLRLKVLVKLTIGNIPRFRYYIYLIKILMVPTFRQLDFYIIQHTMQ